MEEPAPSRDHDPVPAVMPGSCPQGQVQRLLWLFSLLATFSLQRALRSQPKEQPRRTADGSGTVVGGKLKLVEDPPGSPTMFHGSV